jgi:hypothetical protein
MVNHIKLFKQPLSLPFCVFRKCASNASSRKWQVVTSSPDNKPYAIPASARRPFLLHLGSSLLTFVSQLSSFFINNHPFSINIHPFCIAASLAASYRYNQSFAIIILRRIISQSSSTNTAVTHRCIGILCHRNSCGDHQSLFTPS